MKKLASQILPLIALAMIVVPLASDLLFAPEEAPPLFKQVETPPAVQTARAEGREEGLVPAKVEVTPEAWFATVRPHCTPAEAALATDLNRPPDGAEGTGYKAACFALARSIPRARALLLSLPEGDRIQGASKVYEVARHLVEGGQHDAAGPLMELVLEFWPNHYVALYEAGSARFASGEFVGAQAYLSRFLEVYLGNDEMVANAHRMMGDMAQR